MKICAGITGSQGFIGSHLFKALKKTGNYDLTLFDRRHNNLMNKESLKRFVSECDVIFHIAGANRGTNENIIQTNVLGTLNLLEAIKAYCKKKVKLVYVSSIQVYTPSHSDLPVQEDDKIFFPATIFGISKITAENLIPLYDIDSNVFRISNVYGPYSKPFYNSVIATFCHLAANNKAIQINGDGKQKRDFIYISDVIDGLVKSIDCSSSKKGLFNMGSGQLTSLNKIIDVIERVSEKKIEVSRAPQKQEADGWVLTSHEKICSKLDWEPIVNLENGLKETYLYFNHLDKM